MFGPSNFQIFQSWVWVVVTYDHDQPLGSPGILWAVFDCLTRDMKFTMLLRADMIPGDSGNSIIQKSQAWLKQTVAAKHGFMMRLHPRIKGFGGRSQYRISQCGGFGAPIRTVP